MKKRKRLVFSFFIFLLFILPSCEKFVQIGPPNNQLVTASTFDNDASATTALLEIYIQMYQAPESYLMAQHNGLLSDELNNYSTDNGLIGFYTNAMTATGTAGPWERAAYNYIYQANAIIEGLQKYNGVSANTKNILTGESKFVRAFWFFYLTSLYGDIPLTLTTDYSVNALLPRIPQIKVYQQIITDLKDAQNLLPDNYVDASDTVITTEKVRPNKGAASALLARVYLYSADYMNAEIQSTTVIGNTGLYSLCQDLNSVFLKNSTETIWQLMTPTPTANEATPDGNYFILVAAPNGTNNCNTISDQLMNSFEQGDNRKNKWIGAYTVDSITYYYYPYKYKDYVSSTTNEYTMVLRLAEQYLIRAEALTQQNKLMEAINDLNIIRNRAGLLNYTGAMDKLSILAAILHERQTELFTEWGHRWFDLIRTNNANAVMSLVTPLKGGGSWDAHDQLYPIPQNELIKDSKLTQNLGY